MLGTLSRIARSVATSTGALCAIALCSLAASVANADTIRIGAAISLKDALTDIAKTYEADSGDKVELTFGSSGQIQQQIKSGAEVDAFVSAANKQVDELASAGLIDAASRRIVAMNTLVLIVPADAKDPPRGFADLADAKIKWLAVGDPKTVPAGQYAEQVLKFFKLNTAIADRLMFGTSVRQVLTYVETGEVSAGIVYATDARASGAKVKVIATADEQTHEPIVYPAVLVTASKHGIAARKFLDALASEKARATLVADGFTVPAANAAPATAPAHEAK